MTNSLTALAPPTLDHGNPFSTRWTRPGAIPFIFPADCNAAVVVERLTAAGGWGQIVGPHGSGKSTLLQTLLPAIEETGRRHELITLDAAGRSSDSRRRLARRFATGWDRNTLLIVDGYDQLGRLASWQLRRRCRRSGCGLLVTSHRAAGLPTIFTTAATDELAAAVVGQLMLGRSSSITRREIDAAFAAHGGNLREVLFDLYDVVERRRGSPAEPVQSE